MDKEEQNIQISKKNGEKGPVKYRISMMLGAGLTVGAIINDCVNWIPLVGTATDFIYWFIIFVIFYLKGMGIINPRRMALMIVDMIAEAIPALQFLPFTTVGIIMIIVMVRTEDKTGISITKLINPKKALSPGNAVK
ncbi:MAG: hypothetical protein Q7R78_00470 [bacterium]|nr:hypothetical protein [bacterium]